MSFLAELIVALVVIPTYTYLVYVAGRADMMSDVADLWLGLCPRLPRGK